MATVNESIEEVQKALAGTSKSIVSIQRQALGVIAKGTVKAIKNAILSSDLQSHTGELLKAYRYKIRKDGSQANVFPRALKGKDTIFPKACTLSYGHSGPTKRAKNWTIQPRGFVQKGSDFVDSGNYDSDLQKMIDKELSKYWES